MIFPYWEELRDGEARFLPRIPITIRHDQRTVDLLALVDSGAEHNVFGLDVAEELEVDLSNQREVTLVGMGEQPVPGKAAVVDLQLARYTWSAPTIFSAAANERPILGQAGFFHFFTVIFRQSRRVLEIRCNRMPSLTTW